ncbi:MAG: hypothetical protein EOO05_07290 [Chitinophagaceae bacterium]|nr:MAG: hypothetical protein EOO05_07290 [Chitinophagaceae bacterium]
MIEVFQTNVEKEFQARIIIAFLLQQFPGSRINFDLDDCDRILRIEGQRVCPVRVVDLMRDKGFQCAALD